MEHVHRGASLKGQHARHTHCDQAGELRQCHSERKKLSQQSDCSINDSPWLESKGKGRPLQGALWTDVIPVCHGASTLERPLRQVQGNVRAGKSKTQRRRKGVLSYMEWSRKS